MRSSARVISVDAEGNVESVENAAAHAVRERLRWLAWLLDSSIPVPGTRFTVGVDALIGLFPIVGDLIGAALSSVILAEAAVFALAKLMPRLKAEELVKKACAVAMADSKPLIDVVRDLSKGEIGDGTVDWQVLGKPENYVGESNRMLDRALESANKFLV